ncbi:hypothetical protein ACE6H2_016520 [Prunus campanulata]
MRDPFGVQTVSELGSAKSYALAADSGEKSGLRWRRDTGSFLAGLGGVAVAGWFGWFRVNSDEEEGLIVRRKKNGERERRTRFLKI